MAQEGSGLFRWAPGLLPGWHLRLLRAAGGWQCCTCIRSLIAAAHNPAHAACTSRSLEVPAAPQPATIAISLAPAAGAGACARPGASPDSRRWASASALDPATGLALALGAASSTAPANTQPGLDLGPAAAAAAPGAPPAPAAMLVLALPPEAAEEVCALFERMVSEMQGQAQEGLPSEGPGSLPLDPQRGRALREAAYWDHYLPFATSWGCVLDSRALLQQQAEAAAAAALAEAAGEAAEEGGGPAPPAPLHGGWLCCRRRRCCCGCHCTALHTAPRCIAELCMAAPPALQRTAAFQNLPDAARLQAWTQGRCAAPCCSTRPCPP